MEVYVSPEELAEELVVQNTLLLTLDSTVEDRDQIEANIKEEIAIIEAKLRALRGNKPANTARGGTTGWGVGASKSGSTSLPQQYKLSSSYSNHNPNPTDPFSSDPAEYDKMDSSNSSSASAGRAPATNLLSASKLNLPARKRSFGEQLGFDSAEESENKSRRASPDPLPRITKSYAGSSLDSAHDDPVVRGLELHNTIQKKLEEKASKVKEDEEYARRLQETYSTNTTSLSGVRPAIPSARSAYDRMMGRQSQPQKPSLQRVNSHISSSESKDSSSAHTQDFIAMPGLNSHRSVETRPSHSVSPYAPGSTLPGSAIPGAYPVYDSDSDIEIISPNDFHQNNRQHSVSKPRTAAHGEYGSYPSATFQVPGASFTNHNEMTTAVPPAYVGQLPYNSTPGTPSNLSLPWPTATGSSANGDMYSKVYNQTLQTLGSDYPSMVARSMYDPVAQILNKTSAVDFAAMRDRLSQGLAGEIYNYVGDPRKTEKEIQNLLANIRPDTEIPKEDREGTPEGLKYPLYEHQKLALTWLKSMEEGSNKGGILADDMGLGKTISTLALLLSRPSHHQARKTTLIVGPVALIRQWEREIFTKIKSSYKLSTFIYHSGKKATWSTLRTHDVVLTTYGTLAAEYKRFMDLENRKRGHPGMDDSAYQTRLPFLGKNSRWYRVILDEAQCIKNKNTKAALAASQLQADTRFCLTGTPMMNGVHELYSLIHFLKIKPYNEYSRFTAEFSCLTKGTGPEYTMRRAMKKLQAVLKAILLRRTKQSQIDGKPILVLPEKTEEVVHAIFDEDEQDYYTSLEKKTRLQFNKYLKAGTIGKNYSNILVLLLRLRQAACHPHLIMDFEEAPTEATAEEMLALAKALLPDVVGRIMAATVPFECPVCYDPVPNPSIVVPCGHDTCAQCLVKISGNFDQDIANGEDSTSAKCPTCRGTVDLKKIIDYETFKQAHMPDAISQFDDAEGTDDEDSDDDISSSDSELDEDVDRNGNLRGFIIADDHKSSSGSDTEDDNLATATGANVGFGNQDSEDNDDDLDIVRPKEELKQEVKSEIKEEEECLKTLKVKPEEKMEADVIVKGELASVKDENSDDDGLPADPFATFRDKPKRVEKGKSTGLPRPSTSKSKPRPKSKKSRRTKKPSKGKKMDKEPKVNHTSLSKLKKEASKSAEGRRRYMRYLKKNWVSSSKIDKCMEILKNTAPDVKTIIFSQFTTLLDLAEVPIQREKLGYGRYDGSMTADARNGAIVKFTDDPRCKILLVSLKAGNAGLNLVAASQVIILDPFWNPYVEMQAVDRAHRIGQQKPVKVHRILVEGTVEDRIIELQNRKRKLVEAALDENASRSVGRLGREELIYLFGNNDGPERETLARHPGNLGVGIANRGGFGLGSQPILAGRQAYPPAGGVSSTTSTSSSP